MYFMKRRCNVVKLMDPCLFEKPSVETIENALDETKLVEPSIEPNCGTHSEFKYRTNCGTNRETLYGIR